MSTEDWMALGTVAGSLVSWALTQARTVGKIEGRFERSSVDQGRRIGALEDRVKELEATRLHLNSG